MKDFLVKTLLELSEESEKRTSQVVIKILYLLNCIIVSIWIAKQLGFNMDSDVLSYNSLIALFTELYIIIPVFLIVFTTVGTRIITRLIANLIRLIMEPIFYITLFKKKKLIIFLVDNKAIGQDLSKGEEFDSVKKNLDELKTILSDGVLWIEYYAALLLTFNFIYTIVVVDKFPSLYFMWIAILLIIIGLTLSSFLGFIYYCQSKIKETEKLFESVKG